MVISFQHPLVLGCLLETGFVYTYRKGKNIRKQIGNDWANSGRGTKKICDVTVKPIKQVMDITIDEQLEGYVDHSGFNNLNEWLHAIRGLNRYIPVLGWLYKVSVRPSTPNYEDGGGKMSKIEITQLFYPEDKNLEHFYEVLDKLEKERLKREKVKKNEV